jgi:hypothetical protein
MNFDFINYLNRKIHFAYPLLENSGLRHRIKANETSINYKGIIFLFKIYFSYIRNLLFS